MLKCFENISKQFFILFDFVTCIWCLSNQFPSFTNGLSSNFYRLWLLLHFVYFFLQIKCFKYRPSSLANHCSYSSEERRADLSTSCYSIKFVHQGTDMGAVTDGKAAKFVDNSLIVTAR